eukprot:scaffold63_cov306-Pinguiococcus_pyrenoidosus.AAC.45
MHWDSATRHHLLVCQGVGQQAIHVAAGVDVARFLKTERRRRDGTDVERLIRSQSESALCHRHRCHLMLCSGGVPVTHHVHVDVEAQEVRRRRIFRDPPCLQRR